MLVKIKARALVEHRFTMKNSCSDKKEKEKTRQTQQIPTEYLVLNYTSAKKCNNDHNGDDT